MASAWPKDTVVMSFRMSDLQPRLKTRQPARWAHLSSPPDRPGHPRVMAFLMSVFFPLGERLLLHLLLSRVAGASVFRPGAQAGPPVRQVPGSGVAQAASEHDCGIFLTAKSTCRIPRFTVPHRHSVFYRSEVWGDPVLGKSNGSISPKAFAHFMSLCHILVILTVSQTFHDYYICYSDL